MDEITRFAAAQWFLITAEDHPDPDVRDYAARELITDSRSEDA